MPAIAEAAAVAGLARCVRLARPCRFSKLRLDVDMHRAPAGTVSSFKLKHIEQPGSRHSNPAALKMRSRPCASAAALTV